MSHGGSRVQGRNRRKGKNKGLKVNDEIDVALGSPYEEAPRASDSSFKREIAASLIQNHPTVERNSHALQLVSPASYNNSIEVTPYSPRTFLGYEGKIGNSHFNLETSNELALVLDRIWTLEEQHNSNISLVNSMKKELDQSHTQIKVLLREKSKEQDRVKAKIKSIKEELEDEKSLRKKLVRELLDIKSSFVETLREYEVEKKSRLLLENMCDEFAKGISNYEQEVRQLKLRPNKELFKREGPDKLILHLSEAWLDRRMQMNQESEKGSVVDKLSVEIETFLRSKGAKHSLSADKLAIKKPVGKSSLRRHSCESLYLNDAKDGGDSTSTSHCIQSHLKENPKSNSKKKLNSRKKQGKVEGIERMNLIQILSIKEETLRADDEVTKVTSIRAYGSKESTLKSKLLEARLEGQH